jgi:hypothetical protein
MQTLVEVTFVLALVLPPLVVGAAAVLTLGPSLVHRRSYAGDQRVTGRAPIALDHPAGR